MATAEENKIRARLRRFNIYHVKKTTGKTYRELAKEFGISAARVSNLCQRVEFEMQGFNARQERNQRRHELDLANLLPIIGQIKELTKNGGC